MFSRDTPPSRQKFVAILILVNLIFGLFLALWFSSIDSLSIFLDPESANLDEGDDGVGFKIPEAGAGQLAVVEILTSTPIPSPTNILSQEEILAQTATVDFYLAGTATVNAGLSATPTPTLPPAETLNPILIQTRLPAAGQNQACVVTRPAGWTLYRVQPGDTLFRLSLAAGVDVSEISRVNCLLGGGLLAGTSIYLPQAVAAIPTAQCGPPASWVSYVVQPGDTAFSLASLYGLSVNQVLAGNCLSSTQLRVGQSIFLPDVVLAPTVALTLTPEMTETSTEIPPSLSPEPESSPTATESATGVSSTATVTPSSTPSLAPSSTSTSSVTPTAMPLPSHTPTHTMTAEPTSTVTATPTQITTSLAQAGTVSLAQFSGTLTLLSLITLYGFGATGHLNRRKDE